MGRWTPLQVEPLTLRSHSCRCAQNIVARCVRASDNSTTVRTRSSHGMVTIDLFLQGGSGFHHSAFHTALLSSQASPVVHQCSIIHGIVSCCQCTSVHTIVFEADKPPKQQSEPSLSETGAGGITAGTTHTLEQAKSQQTHQSRWRCTIDFAFATAVTSISVCVEIHDALICQRSIHPSECVCCKESI